MGLAVRFFCPVARSCQEAARLSYVAGRFLQAGARQMGK